MDEFDVRQGAVFVNGITLNVLSAGPKGAPLVVFLHGFPECAEMWRPFFAAFVDAGYRVMAPDQRGYNESSKPKHARDYRIQRLAADLDALRAWAGVKRFHLVAHDWGGIVAWWYGLHYAEHVRSLSIINAPHPIAFRDTLFGSLSQLRKSWYAIFFQLPLIPELFWERRMRFKLGEALRETATPGAFTDQFLETLATAWAQPGAATGMLNWYRAAFRYRPEPATKRMVPPTRILWGENDLALDVEMATQSAAYCDDVELTLYPDGTHWLPHDLPEQVTHAVLAHLVAHPV